MDRTEARAQALRLSINYYREKNASKTELEIMANDFYSYITTGMMDRNG